METVAVHGVQLGFIYTHEAREKPVVTISNSGDVLKEGTIYFRYRGQSAAIKFPELRRLIDDRIARERKAWSQHLEVINRAGPTNVGVVDTIHGRLYGGGPPFLLDEKLVRQLKFVRRGRFSESSGTPVFRVLGEVQPIKGGVEREIPVPVGIHAEDLITAFLAQRDLTEAEARSYLRETTYQPTPFVPLHYFVGRSGLPKDKVEELIQRSGSPLTGQRTRLLNRLSGADLVSPLGSVANLTPKQTPSTTDDCLIAIESAVTQKQKRSLFVAALKAGLSLSGRDISIGVASVFVEAVTHLKASEVRAKKAELLELLLRIFVNSFAAMAGPEKTAFRKAVAYCDEALAGLHDGDA